jgi:glucose-1-phosphate cytidylyltransferase
MLTWCDGLADVDLGALRAFHERHGRLATLSAVHPPARFGRLTLDGDEVRAFREKEIAGDEWINGAFFVLEPAVMDYITGDDTQFEREPLSALAAAVELMARRHVGFWQCMDTLKEAQDLNRLWQEDRAPWKVWA